MIFGWATAVPSAGENAGSHRNSYPGGRPRPLSSILDLLPTHYAENQDKARQQTRDGRTASKPGDFPGDGLTGATGIFATDILLPRSANGGESEVARLPRCQCRRPGFRRGLGASWKLSVQYDADLSNITMMGQGIAPNSVVPASPDQGPREAAPFAPGHTPSLRVRPAARLCGSPTPVRARPRRLSNEVLEISPLTIDRELAMARAWSGRGFPEGSGA